VEQQRSIAVHCNRRNHVAIRAEGEGGYDEDDKVILLATNEALRALIVALQHELKAGV
jgi:hypothetical protein